MATLADQVTAITTIVIPTTAITITTAIPTAAITITIAILTVAEVNRSHAMIAIER